MTALNSVLGRGKTGKKVTTEYTEGTEEIAAGIGWHRCFAPRPPATNANGVLALSPGLVRGTRTYPGKTIPMNSNRKAVVAGNAIHIATPEESKGSRLNIRHLSGSACPRLIAWSLPGSSRRFLGERDPEGVAIGRRLKEAPLSGTRGSASCRRAAPQPLPGNRSITHSGVTPFTRINLWRDAPPRTSCTCRR